MNAYVTSAKGWIVKCLYSIILWSIILWYIFWILWANVGNLSDEWKVIMAYGAYVGHTHALHLSYVHVPWHVFIGVWYVTWWAWFFGLGIEHIESCSLELCFSIERYSSRLISASNFSGPTLYGEFPLHDQLLYLICTYSIFPTCLQNQVPLISGLATLTYLCWLQMDCGLEENELLLSQWLSMMGEFSDLIPKPRKWVQMGI